MHSNMVARMDTVTAVVHLIRIHTTLKVFTMKRVSFNLKQFSRSTAHFLYIEVLLNNHGHSHGPGDNHHGHSHTLDMANSQIMRGVFLHILADTLGSVGVIISACLMHMFGWMIADPICSMFIAILIALSVLSLIKESVSVLMQRQPSSLDRVLPGCYQKVTGLAGVYSVQEPHFWTLCSDFFVGAIKLEVSKNVDPKYVITHTRMIFESVGVRQIYIQLDYASM